MIFRLAGHNAYLIGFMDDYSRYITSPGLYRSQTAEHVLETYRRGIAEYGVPREVLTDNGRPYINWRGKTRFEREMKKDRVKHIRSRPHHPMTLGKIERFWKSIQSEFLFRAQFDSFEQAVERTAYWIKYYNYKRPHQGIGGLCPADRFFEIQHDLKRTLEKGIEENALELAPRGRPVDPFYMVGRMGGQSVVNLGQLRQEINDLDHGSKRSRGTGRLYGAFSDAVSRRQLNRMMRIVRDENNRRRLARRYHVTWLRPNLVWAMDDCQRIGSGTFHLHNLSDLCSRYKFSPLASAAMPCGEEVAGHLSRLFSRFGAPLFSNRDNGGNLNHVAVNKVLEQALVIPINSPPYMASYNGATEHSQGEFKNYLRRWQWKADTIKAFGLLAETTAHALNHIPRRCLKGRAACCVYFGKNRIRYPKRRRKSIYNWICDLAAEVSIRAGKKTISPVAWRVAAREWLEKNGLIKIQRAGKVLPNFSLNLCHN